MEKRTFRHLVTWLFVLIFAFGVVLPLSPDAKAEGNPQYISGVEYYIPDSTIVYLDTPAQYSLSYQNASLKDITKLKSSNKNVATVKKPSILTPSFSGSPRKRPARLRFPSTSSMKTRPIVLRCGSLSRNTSIPLNTSKSARPVWSSTWIQPTTPKPSMPMFR